MGWYCEEERDARLKTSRAETDARISKEHVEHLEELHAELLKNGWHPDELQDLRSDINKAKEAAWKDEQAAEKARHEEAALQERIKKYEELKKQWSEQKKNTNNL